MALGLVNVTGRVSDARAAGFVIDCRRRTDKRQAYYLVEQAQQELGLAS
jgi:hypothetical protein